MILVCCESLECFHSVTYRFVSSLQARAKQLYNAGYKTPTHLANADPAVLSKTIENLYKKQAEQIVASAKVSPVHMSSMLRGFEDDTMINVWTVCVYQMMSLCVPDACE